MLVIIFIRQRGGSQTDRNSCINGIVFDWYLTPDCAKENYLQLENHERVLSPVGDQITNNRVFNILSRGGVNVVGAATASSANIHIRPSLFLKTSVKITNGDGSLQSPFELSFSV